jgi:chromodomain-helicase-DNA-binding protein 7
LLVPQDIQAQARAHRIGQTRAVKVYRLITKGTYENEMFNKSSLKLGLDHAVLKTYTSNTKDGPPVLNKEEIENMLKRV